MQREKGYTLCFRKYPESRTLLHILNFSLSALCARRPYKALLHGSLFSGFRALLSPGGHPSDPSFIALGQHRGILLTGTEAWQPCSSKSIFACSHWKLELFTQHSLSALLLHVSRLGSTDIPLSLDGWITPASLHCFCFSVGFVWGRSIFLFLSAQAMHSP